MTTPTGSSPPRYDDWRYRSLAAQVAANAERRERIRALRADLTAARSAGKRLRHARRLAQIRAQRLPHGNTARATK